MLAKLFPKKFRKLIFMLLHNKFTRIKYGNENKDMTFLVIGGHSAGLYSIIHNIVGYLIYADQKRLIPVIDYTNHPTYYHYKDNKENIWDLFFFQPSKTSLKEVYQSKNVLHTPTTFSDNCSALFDHIVDNQIEKLYEVNRIFKKYIRYNYETSMFIENL
jgi:hypothetical protein